MTTTQERLVLIDEKIVRAVTAVAQDAGASPVLAAVVQEFKRKSEKALSGMDGADERAVRDAVIEVEQAADSAKAAAEADSGVADGTRQAVLDAHLSICILKSKL